MNEFKPIEVADYYPNVVVRLLKKIEMINSSNIVLFGFSDNMKWLLRLLQERGVTPLLADWRDKYLDYDCGGFDIQGLQEVADSEETLLVVCIEEINDLKDAIRHLYTLQKNNIKVVYDRADPNMPLRQEEPYKTIFHKARSRAESMISDAQLFDLIQFIDQTKSIDGDVVEYGSLYGGSGAVLAEAVNYFGAKPIWLFDSFEGIPDSRYGLDHHWNGSFSDNSYAQVRDAFADLENVKVIRGNICETYNQVSNDISFGYIASDTLETGELLLDFLWPKLSSGGMIVICDYGSFPNAIPLTVYADYFFQDKRSEAFFYRPDEHGLCVLKR